MGQRWVSWAYPYEGMMQVALILSISFAEGHSPPIRSRVDPMAVLLAIAVLSGIFPCLSTAQVAQQIAPGSIEILEPVEWRGGGERGLLARAKRSLRVVGIAQHLSGIREVRLNGERAALQVEPTGGVRFTGYVQASAGAREVEVTAYPVTGRFFSRLYNLEVLPAEQSYESPDEAWSAAGGVGPQRWAVVIGISDYQDRRVFPLRYADNDAQALYDFLVSEQAGLGGFDPNNIRLLINEEATTRNIRSALFSFLRGSTEDDVVLIFFAGHGTADPERIEEYYLLWRMTRTSLICRPLPSG